MLFLWQLLALRLASAATANMMEKYIIGTTPVPAWCRSYLMQYLRADGSTGWEFYGKVSTFELRAGDALILTERGISVENKKRA